MVWVGLTWSWLVSSGWDWVSLASVGILVSGSAPAGRPLLGRSLKWCSSSSVQITPFNWPPAPWTGANYSSLSLMLCISALVFQLQWSHFYFFLLLFLFIVIFIITGIDINVHFQFSWSVANVFQRPPAFLWRLKGSFLKDDSQCHWGKITFSLVSFWS